MFKNFHLRFVPKTNIATYIILSTGVIFLIVAFLISFFGYNESKKTSVFYCNQVALMSNAKAIFIVDGDEIEHFSKTLVADDKFKSFKKRLDEFTEVMGVGVKYFYILFDNGVPGEYTYIYGNDMAEEDYTIGSTELKGEFIGADEVLKTGEKFEEAIHYKGKYGDIYYAYAPIFNSKGKVVAFLGTDIDFSPFQKQVDDYRNKVILVLIFATMFFSVVFFYLIRKILIKPMKFITDNATALSDGNLELQFPSEIFNNDNEISQLGHVFKHLSDNIKGVIRGIENIMQSVQRGYMDQRVQAGDYQGEFEKIIFRINDTIDIVCHHFDSIPERIAFIGVSSLKTRYANAAMNHFLKIHGLLDNESNIIDGIINAIEDEGVKDGITEFFRKKQQDGSSLISRPRETYEIRLRTITGSEEKFYSMSLLDIEVYGDSKYVIMILSDITTLVQERNNANLANRAKSDFLSKMSHEIRTPMNAIMGMAKIAETSSDIENIRYCISTIQTSSEHLLRVINDILDMSKIEAGKLELSNEPFNIEEMLTKICNIIFDKVKEKNIKFNLDFNSEDIQSDYTGDELRLSQVTLNLLSNAVKFTPNDGQITLSVKKTSDGEKYSTLVFSVLDTGIGMNHEQINRLFVPFEQADNTTSKNYGGTGLGLAISKHIIEKMDGQIQVNSLIGQGSTFTFEVTLEKAVLEEREKISFENEINDFSNISMLLVDDIKVNREIVINLLKDTQIKIDEAQNGFEAVKKFENSLDKYDIIMMDIQMPEMDGYEATRLIRLSDVQNAKTVSIIAMTANVFKEDIEKCLESGMNDHLAKPLNKDAMIEKIKHYCQV